MISASSVVRNLPHSNQIAAIVCLTIAFAATLRATSEYDYKRGEFLVIKDGKSPDKKFAIVSGENQKGEFGVYLMDAPTKKIIGKLEEVATDLDTAPDAYYAHWSPDSKHVGISSRSDRHMLENVIYRIEGRRAFLVQAPELRCHAVPNFCQLLKELGASPDDPNKDEGEDSKVRQNSNTSEITKWLSPTHFIVAEESQFQVRTRDPSAAIGKYGEVEKENDDSADSPGGAYHVWFNTEGECELLPGDKSQVISTHSGSKK
ncbi:MAG TPA: hypothetical protein VLK27_01655 [Chthoniobacterales bacterium]|nr:hypothetical protein [Chthoniobacterales bacterium]